VKETVSLIRLDNAVGKAIKQIPKQRYGQFDTFPRSAKNYVFAAIWRLIENQAPRHPLLAYSDLPSAWGTNIARLVFLFYGKVGNELRSGVSINDIFRTQLYWERCRDAFGPRHRIFRDLMYALEAE
jgi:hypothetical protein